MGFTHTVTAVCIVQKTILANPNRTNVYLYSEMLLQPLPAFREKGTAAIRSQVVRPQDRDQGHGSHNPPSRDLQDKIV